MDKEANEILHQAMMRGKQKIFPTGGISLEGLILQLPYASHALR